MTGSPERSSTPVCKFFLTEQGCKKGKSCSFQHNLDDQKRCWNCGSSLHFSPKCDRPRDGDLKGGKGEGKMVRMAKKEEGAKKEDAEKSESGGSTEVMKGLLEEANKMLKAMSSSTGGSIEEGSKEQKLTRLQQQLDELKIIKVFKISKVIAGSGEGLLDSGATHSLRERQRGEDLSVLKQIDVTLACGKTMRLRMTKGGTMVSEEKDVEPIIPLGKMVSVLKCSLDWSGDAGLRIWHPSRGWLPVKDRGGCPHVPKELAMKLINEMEEKSKQEDDDRTSEVKKAEGGARREEEKWLQDFVDCHPVLRELPEKLKKRLVVPIEEKIGKIPGVNKRDRKKWYQKGVTVHLYSGEPGGFNLEAAVKEKGGDLRRLLEVDVKKGKEFDMVEDPMYSSLLRMAMDDVVEAVVCGPNCRTRSVLRHIPIPGQPDAPRPVRRWGGEEWGNWDNTSEERKKVEEDDVMLWRAITLALVSTHHRRAVQPHLQEVQFLVEQPSSPQNYPEVVSLWRTEEWKKLCEVYGWKEIHFNQGDWGGKAEKPTTVGGSMELIPPTTKNFKNGILVRSSKELERWSPGMMREVARWLVEEAQGGEAKARMLSWDEHIQLGHVPFRRDCKICQESRQKQHPHRKVKHPLSGVLSLDTSGPHKDGQDLAFQARYMKEMKEAEVELPDDAPPLEDWKDGRHLRKERRKNQEDEAEARGDEDEEGEVELEDLFGEDSSSPEVPEERGRSRRPRSSTKEQGIRAAEVVEEEGEKKEDEEVPEGWEIRVFRLVAPMSSKKTEETLKTAIEFVLRLRADGFWVNQIHTDQGHEYYGQFKNWCSKRGIVLTRTAGDDPQGNGRAEVAVYAVNRQVRATLLLKNIPTAQEWIAIEEDLVNALVKRRRMREKTTPIVKQLKEEEEEDEDVRRSEVRRVERIIEEEMGRLVEEDPVIIPQVMEVMVKMRRMAEGSLDDEILQTRIVSPMEVLRDWEEWVGPAEDEVHSLLQEKKAFREISSEELERMKLGLEEEGRKIEIIPSKLVWTKKPDLNHPTKGKNKVRWVICGNFEEKKESEQTYSGGADSTALRAVMVAAAERQWVGATVDVKTAFLNADMNQEDEEEVLVIKPPALFLEKQVVKKGSYFVPQKAVYGLRRSPRLWGRCRDEGLRGLEVEAEVGEGKQKKFRLFQLDSEPNLWRISQDHEEHYVETPIEGFVMTYVDDMIVVGTEKVVHGALEAIQRKWKTSSPEWISEDPVRFLGVEISRVEDEERGCFDWRISQASYVQQLLKNEKEEVKERRIPVSKELVAKMSEDEEGVTSSEVKAAQKLVGELLWVVTRSRPDLMYVVSKMGSRVTKSPRMVLRAGDQVRGFLKFTQDHGLIFKKKEMEASQQMDVFTDASFSPEGEESHGCVVVMMNNGPVAWKSSRQTVISLSTAESELLEIIEGFMLGESTAVLFEETLGSFSKMLWSDSQSALSVLGGEGGSWRTRHVRMRAMYARQLVTQGSWGVHHCPGEDMVADIGTKALSSARIDYLKEKIGMVSVQAGRKEEYEEKDAQEGGRDEEIEEREERKVKKMVTNQNVTEALKLVIIMASMSVGEAQGGEEEDQWFWKKVFVVLVIVVVLAMLGLFSVCQWMMSLRKKPSQPEEEPMERREERNERVRRRGGPSEDRMSEMSFSSQQLTPREVIFVRQQFEAVQRTPERRNWVEDPPGQEPSHEPGTFREEFLAGGVVMVEEVQHPEDWDPEIHGDIPIGKGCPPESYFLREKGKGGKPSGVKGSEEKGKEGKKGGEKGRSVGNSHGSSVSSIAASSTSVPPPSKGGGKGVGSQIGNDQFPGDPGHGKGAGRRRVFVTPYGTKYHLFASCRTVRNTRVIRYSSWCEVCSSQESEERRPVICCIGPGHDAHYNLSCPLAVGRQLSKCSVCDEMDG